MKEEKTTIIKAHLRGMLCAVILSLVLILGFALLIKLTGLSSGAIKPIAQIIKVISIFFGVAVALKNIERLGWLHGALLGILYTVIAFFLFSIIDSNFGITVGFLTDMLFSIAIGAASGMLLKMRKGAHA